MEILGVRVDNLTKKEIVEKIESFLDEPKFHQICTVNAEFVLEAQKNELFKNILSQADLNVADSISMSYAFLRYGKWLKCRFAGADLMHAILKIANKKKLGVFLAANRNGLSTWEETAAALRKIYPSIIFGGDNINFSCHSGLDLESKQILKQVQDDKVNLPAYQILFCSLGAPDQELFINKLKSDSIRLAMGVGGAFDFVTGKLRRAPGIWRKIGMEWLWRFIQEPRYRARRIFNAVIVFSIEILFNFNEK